MRSTTGASMIELLVALTLAGLVAAVTLSVTLSSREMYDSDRGRIDLNQNLRIGLDLLGLDVREAGEGLPLDFPAVEIVNGSSGAPDTLILRRNLLGSVLPLCASISSGASVGEIRIGWSSTAPPVGCAVVPDSDADGWPDNVGEWRAHRTGNGGTVSVYLFNPVTRAGEFVDFDGDGSTSDFISLTSAQTWQNGYGPAAQCRVYVLEEHRYQLTGGVLEYLVDGDGANPVRLVDGMVDFQVSATLTDSSVVSAFAATDDWSELQSIEIQLTGEAEAPRRNIRKTLAARFFPRQVASL